ncbi:hypothetical protein OVA19_00195 [Streptomyces sp. SL203]|nr:hypothetical protein [Streptomyces sp. SL203]MCY1649242.1 hypothetical protein [Streptomyces sp. SL203]
MSTPTTPTLADLREQAERDAKQAEESKAKLLEAAVEAAVTSTAYGHVTNVAREANITAQYLRELVERAHPGWLAKAAKKRDTDKAKAAAKRRPAGKRGGAAAA